MAALLLTGLALLLYYPITICYALYQKWAIAKTTGLPVVMSPVESYSLPWMVLQPLLLPIITRLPFGLGSWIEYNSSNWAYNGKNQIHQKIGKVTMHATPTRMEMLVADAAVVRQIMPRGKVFFKFAASESAQEACNLFGKNIVTVEGDDWRRHTKMISPQFNERNYALVWQVSNQQAIQMLEHNGDKPLCPILDDTGRVALNVFASAGLGIDNQFRGTFDHIREGCEFSFREALDSSFHNMINYAVTPNFLYNMPGAPQGLKDIKRKVGDLKLYLTDMVEQAREKALLGVPPRPNLLHTVVSKTIEEKTSGAKSGGTDMYLTDSEIHGNLFIIGFAGHDTTASALEYAAHLLAANPEQQDWVFEELNEVFAGHDEIQNLDYEACYPRLKRCLAILYEGVRRYGPAPLVVKYTKEPTTITHEGRVANIPAGTVVTINTQGLQHDEEYWGPDVMEWKPSRWVITPPGPVPESKSQVLEKEEFLIPPKGQFVPWSDGLRVCPGKKFSSVEFVGVLSIWLWKHRIEIVPNPGESQKEARKRILNVVEDSVVTINLGIRDRKGVKLRFVKR